MADPPLAPVLQDNSIYSHEVRKHYQTTSVAVGIPILQSIVTGFLVSFITFGLVLMVKLILPSITVLIAFGVAALSFGIAALVTWIHLLRHWKSNIQRLEQKLGIDIDLDGKIGGTEIPQVGEFVTSIILKPEGSNTIERAKFNMHPETFAAMVEIILEKAKFTEDLLIAQEGIFDTRDDFIFVREEFLRIGVLQWKNAEHRDRGLIITSRGVHILEGYLKAPPPSLVSYTN
jgi:hypothetical protein